MKRGPSTVAARSRTSPLGESNTRPGPLVRDHPGWHNPRLDCHTPRPDDCAPKSRSPEFARLYRAGRIFRCSFQQGMELKVGLEPQPTHYECVALPTELFQHFCSAPGRGRLPTSRQTLSNDASRPALSFLRFLARIPGWCYRRDLNPYTVSSSRF